jgi:hypothetical protein
MALAVCCSCDVEHPLPTVGNGQAAVMRRVTVIVAAVGVMLGAAAVALVVPGGQDEGFVPGQHV